MQFSRVKVLILLVFANSLWSSSNGLQDCIPYSRCEEVQWIVAKGLDIEISQCGYNQEVLVWCNIRSIEEVSELAAMSSVMQSSQCSGSMIIYYIHSNGSIRQSRLRSGRHYRNMRKFQNVYRVSVSGTCCWRLHQQRFFRGSPEHLSLGFDDSSPLSKIVSARSTEC